MKNNENQLNDLFEKARNQEPKTSFNETKGQLLNNLKAGKTSSLNQGIANSFKFKNWIIMLSTVSVIIVSSVLLLNSNTKPIEIKENNEEKVVLAIENRVEASTNTENDVISVEMVTIEKNEIKTTTTTFNVGANDSIVVTSKVEKDTAKPILIANQNYPKRSQIDTNYRFPKLTLEEIEANNKQKAKMLKQLGKLNKEKYVYVPAGSYKHKGKSVSVQAFYMGATEVTVLEYRTFLFDLLIHGRKKEFLIAKPDQEQWKFIMGNKQSSMQPMTDLYFSHPAYNEYPVNNISRKGAEMYCKWLLQSFRNSNVKKVKYHPALYSIIRLPTNYEWMHAAMGNLDGSDFPWGGSSVKNKKDCYLANYKPIVDSANKLVKNASFKQFTTNEGVLKGAVYVEGHITKDTSLYNNFMIDGAFNTAKVTSYLPNDYGLYCMSGNVAEMVWSCPDSKSEGKNRGLIYCDFKNQTPGTKGGSWTSDLDEIKITGEDKFKGITAADANIGFRVVVTYLGRGAGFPKGMRGIKITKFTTKEELERFKAVANKNGITFEYKARIINRKIKSLTVNIDNDDNPKNCGGSYFKGSLSGQYEYVIFGWKDDKNGNPEIFMTFSE